MGHHGRYTQYDIEDRLDELEAAESRRQMEEYDRSLWELGASLMALDRERKRKEMIDEIIASQQGGRPQKAKKKSGFFKKLLKFVFFVIIVYFAGKLFGLW